MSDLTYPSCRFNECDNNTSSDNSNKNCNDYNKDNNNGNTDNKHKNISKGNIHFCYNNVQCVINEATNDTKFKLADNM